MEASENRSARASGNRLKIGVISDLHLGGKWGTPLEDDSFRQANEAIEKILQAKAQLILVLGDIFDTRIPRQEVWARAMRILALPLSVGKSDLKFREAVGKKPEEISKISMMGVPVVALHGNHERRVKGLINPVEALEAAGFLIHLHANAVVFDTPAGRLAIHGLSNVPERHAKNVLSVWNPRPIDGAHNILILHQAIGQYVYSSEESPSLSLEDLPRGFDIYLCGHVHCRAEAQAHGRPLLIPGSLVRTQLLQAEAQLPKGFYLMEIGEGIRYEFVELQNVRDFYYEEMKFENADVAKLNSGVRSKLNELLQKPRRNPDQLPLVRLKLKGTLAKGVSRGDFEQTLIANEFADRAIVYIDKDELTAPGVEEKVKFLRDLREHHQPVDEMAMRLLEVNLREMGYNQMLDFRMIYDLVAEDRLDEAFSKVIELSQKMAEGELRVRKS